MKQNVLQPLRENAWSASLEGSIEKYTILQEEAILNGNPSIPYPNPNGNGPNVTTLSQPHPLDHTPLAFLSREVELFRSPDGEPCITVKMQSCQETWPLRAKAFKRWLTWRFYKLTGNPIDAPMLKKVSDFLTAIALFECQEHPVFTRIAEYEGGLLYLDLHNDTREAVEITAEGWRAVTEPPVRFARYPGMAALPYPEHGGSLVDLRAFLNVSSDADFMLLVSWVLAALRPNGPYPILVLQGEQDSAKSTVTKVLRKLVDPHTALLKRTVRDERDLFIAANNQWVLALDNLSHLQPWLSDALCTISTGGGYSTRKLYTDDEEISFNVTRPMILNGIEDIATRGDFIDRALVLHLPSIADADRRDERLFWADFALAQPRLLGALLDAVSAALRNLSSVTLQDRPRMYDFALWACAAAPACNWGLTTAQGELTGAKAFMEVYLGNRAVANDTTLEASAVAQAMLLLAEKSPAWSGTATELMAVLRTITVNERGDKLPKAANALSGELRRLAPNLRKIGVHLEFTRRAGGKERTITLRAERDGTART
jgi:hypothetical protein